MTRRTKVAAAALLVALALVGASLLSVRAARAEPARLLYELDLDLRFGESALEIGDYDQVRYTVELARMKVQIVELHQRGSWILRALPEPPELAATRDRIEALEREVVRRKAAVDAVVAALPAGLGPEGLAPAKAALTDARRVLPAGDRRLQFLADLVQGVEAGRGDAALTAWEQLGVGDRHVHFLPCHAAARDDREREYAARRREASEAAGR